MRNAQAMRWASDRGPASVPPEKVARRAVPPAEKGGSLDDGWWGFGATGYEKDDTSFYANCTQGWNYLRGDCKIMQSFDIGAPAEGRPHSHGGRAAPLHASCCGQASTRGPSRSTSGSTRPTRCRRCTATHAPLHRRLSLPLPAASPRRRHHQLIAATTPPPPPPTHRHPTRRRRSSLSPSMRARTALGRRATGQRRGSSTPFPTSSCPPASTARSTSSAPSPACFAERGARRKRGGCGIGVAQ